MIHRHINLWGADVNSLSTLSLIDDMTRFINEDPQGLITLNIFSNGGDFHAGIGLYNWLRAHVIDLQTVAYGAVNSMAVIIFCASRNARIAAPDATFHLHPLRDTYGSGASMDLSDYRRAMTSLMKRQNTYLDILASTTGHDRNALKRMMDRHTTLSAQQALDIGLVTDIGMS